MNKKEVELALFTSVKTDFKAKYIIRFKDGQFTRESREGSGHIHSGPEGLEGH